MSVELSQTQILTKKIETLETLVDGLRKYLGNQEGNKWVFGYTYDWELDYDPMPKRTNKIKGGV